MTGYLVLDDGEVFKGEFLGETHWECVGEVVFNTSLVGYQEIVTDPSYYRQIIVMTAPEQGNYGTLAAERESKRVWAQGFVCLEFNDVHKSRHRRSLESELFEFKSPILNGVDTRSLTLHLRSRGTPWGTIVCTQSVEEAKIIGRERIRQAKEAVGSDWVYEVSQEKTTLHQGSKQKGRIALIDYGFKKSILDQLLLRVKEVAVFNSRATAKEILDWNPDGLFLSNGPGDPAAVEHAPEIVKQLLGTKPMFGICMGHQILSLALGGRTYKLKFGHRGSNHPVKNFATGEIYMTAQNHGYAVDPDLPTGVQLSQINLYDKTIEGIECKAKKAWSVQYHPEAGPGPHDSRVLFDHFVHEVVL